MFATPSRMPKLLPWADWHEWSRCMQQLFAGFAVLAQPPYSTTDASTLPLPLSLFSSRPVFNPSDASAQHDALDLVSVWRARGRLPLSVDLTAQLVQAQQADALSAASSSPSELSLRQQYSLCVVRLVNGLADANQSRAHAVSVNAIAASLSLPRLLVDARHDATHGQLPSLPLLRYAAAEALRYLYRHYWQTQEAASTALERQLTHSLAQYQQAAKDDRQAALRAVFALSISPSHLSALLVSALFSSSSSLLLLRPPAPLLPPPLSAATVTRHFQHLLSAWDALLSLSCQRIRNFRVDAVRHAVTELVALTVQAAREQTDAAQQTEEEQQEEDEEEERRAEREWQMALLVEWIQWLLSGLKAGQQDASWLSPLASLALQHNSSRTLAVGRQLMQQMRLTAASSPQWSLLTRSRPQQPHGDDGQGSAPLSLEEMKAWCRQHAAHSFPAAAAAAVTASQSRVQERSLQAGAELCSDWLRCPLGALPHQSRPQLDDAVVRKRRREEQSEQEAQAAATTAAASQQPPAFAWDEAPEPAVAARVQLCSTDWQLPPDLSAAVAVLQRSIVTI